MTVEDLTFAFGVTTEELKMAQITLNESTLALGVQVQSLGKNQAIKRSLVDSMAHFKGSMVVSLSEYVSLKQGMAICEEQMATAKARIVILTKKKDAAAEEILRTQRRLDELEKRIEINQAPAKILEFRRK